jgi:hypothetical protein
VSMRSNHTLELPGRSRRPHARRDWSSCTVGGKKHSIFVGGGEVMSVQPIVLRPDQHEGTIKG